MPRPLHQITLAAELARDLDGILYLALAGRITEDEATVMARRTVTAFDTEVLRAEFPGFRIWHETICGQAGWAAVAQREGLHPHTVMASTPHGIRLQLGVPQ
jgi:hypothetical protein